MTLAQRVCVDLRTLGRADGEVYQAQGNKYPAVRGIHTVATVELWK